VRGSIRREENGETRCPERFKEPLQDHGVSHIEYLELIDREKRHWGGEKVAYYGDCVALLAPQLLVYFVFSLMYL
jgi:hypothetical protein